jgi:hypothetical protein
MKVSERSGWRDGPPDPVHPRPARKHGHKPDRSVAHFRGSEHQPANVRAFEDVLRKRPPRKPDD